MIYLLGELFLCCRILMLSVLERVMRSAEPRVTSYHTEILIRLLRLLVDTGFAATISNDAKQAIGLKIHGLVNVIGESEGYEVVASILEKVQAGLGKDAEHITRELSEMKSLLQKQ